MCVCVYVHVCVARERERAGKKPQAINGSSTDSPNEGEKKERTTKTKKIGKITGAKKNPNNYMMMLDASYIC